MNKQLILDALNLSKRVPHVFLLGIIVSLITRIPVIGYVGSIIYSGLILALPTFLKDAQENKKFNIKDTISTLWSAVKKSFFPVLVSAIVLLIVLAIILFIIFLIFFKIFGSSAVSEFMRNPQNLIGWNLSSILFVLFFVILFTPFSMIPIYYTIKLESFRKSIFKSIMFNLKNPKFFIFLLLFESINVIINKLLFINSNFNVLFILQLVYPQMIMLFTSAFCLLYFQKSEK